MATSKKVVVTKVPTGLKTRKDGSYIVSSDRHVQVALQKLDEIDALVEEYVGPLAAQRAAIKEAVELHVIKSYSAGEGYEDDDWMATKVVGHTRKWNVDKLLKLVPRGILKPALKVTVDGAKIDELVRAGKIGRNSIKAAFEETPNKPYVKITRRKRDDGKADAEADSLAGKLA